MRPHRWQPTRLRRPWDSPGKNTGVGCHFLLQCMKVKVKSLSKCPTLRDPMDYSPPGSSVHGIYTMWKKASAKDTQCMIPFLWNSQIRGGLGLGVVVGIDCRLDAHKGTFQGNGNNLVLDCGDGGINIQLRHATWIVYSQCLNFMVCMLYLIRAAKKPFENVCVCVVFSYSDIPLKYISVDMVIYSQ